jgi:hypothetical protein
MSSQAATATEAPDTAPDLQLAEIDAAVAADARGLMEAQFESVDEILGDDFRLVGEHDDDDDEAAISQAQAFDEPGRLREPGDAVDAPGAGTTGEVDAVDSPTSGDAPEIASMADGDDATTDHGSALAFDASAFEAPADIADLDGIEDHVIDAPAPVAPASQKADSNAQDASSGPTGEIEAIGQDGTLDDSIPDSALVPVAADAEAGIMSIAIPDGALEMLADVLALTMVLWVPVAWALALVWG